MFMDSILGLLTEGGLLMERRPEYLEWELRSHRGICSLIAARNGIDARLAMMEHIRESAAALRKVIAQESWSAASEPSHA
jgi:DNA-binding FadR family transcriptional regulator